MPGKFPTGNYHSVCGELVMCGHIPDGYEGKLRQRRADHTALTQAGDSRAAGLLQHSVPSDSGVLRGQPCGWPAPAQCPQ